MSKFRNLFKKPSAAVIAQESMEEAQRQYLDNKAKAEYYAKLADYYEQTTSRLQRYIKDSTDAQA
jgi:hypothetical protein